MDDSTDTRVCKTCHELKPIEDFKPHAQCTGGRVPSCKVCSESRRRGLKDGSIPRRTHCEDCGVDITDRGRAAFVCELCAKERNRASAQRHVDKDPEAHLQRVTARWASKSKDERTRVSRIQMLKKYGLTQDQYDEILAAQGGVCAICKSPETHKYRGVVIQMPVDHDHACCDTNKKTCGECRRGIICHDCNAGIGYFNDDVERMQAAIEYLMFWREQRVAA